MPIGERIKKLRKTLGATQQEFADKLKVSRSNIATYEVGKNNPADAVINLICREFNINETWLRVGEGEMFVQTMDDPVECLCAELHATRLDAEIIRAYFKIDERIREPFMRQLLDHVKASAQTISSTVESENEMNDDVEEYDPELEAEVEEFRRQRRLEKSMQTSQGSTRASAG